MEIYIYMGYIKLPELKVWGFVVNAYSALNLDIDIMFDDEKSAALYTQSSSKSYYFEDKDGDTYRSKAYRCRLVGLSLIPGKKFPSRKVLDTLQKKIHEQRDWVILKISDIDSYNRILVEIIDPLSKNSINDYIIVKFPEVYRKYSFHNYQNSFKYNRWLL